MIDDECGAVGGMRIGRGNLRTRIKLAPAPRCPQQMPHDLTRVRTRAAAVGSRRLTALLPTNLSTPWSEVLPEKPIVAQQFKNLEPEDSLPSSQEPATGPSPEPDQSNPYYTILSKIHSMLSSHLCLRFPLAFPLKSYWCCGSMTGSM
jgi:hypothetical protein